jgi:hypothetical protein
MSEGDVNQTMVATDKRFWWTVIAVVAGGLVATTATSEAGNTRSGSPSRQRSVRGAGRKTVDTRSGQVFNVLAYAKNGACDDNSFQMAINAAAAVSPRGVVLIPAVSCTFKRANFDLSGLDGLQIVGSGIGATVIHLAHPSNDLFRWTTTTYDQTIRDFSVTSDTVARTSGWIARVNVAYNGWALLRRVRFSDLDIKKQVNGLWIAQYEFVWITRCFMTDFVGKKAAITGATNVGPIVITAPGHGYHSNDHVNITGVGGNAAANGTWVITVVDANTFQLNGSNGDGDYTGGGSVMRVGEGIGIKIGQTTRKDIEQGSELYIQNVSIYGNDLAGSNPPLDIGILIEDTDAVYINNVSIGASHTNALKIQANSGGHGPANHFITQSVFDATQAGDSVRLTGGGTIVDVQFTGCWFASAGNVVSCGGTGQPPCSAVSALRIDAGGIARITMTGGTIFNARGTGLYAAPAGPMTISGMTISGNPNQDAIYIDCNGLNNLGPVLSGNQITTTGAGYAVKTSNVSSRMSVNGNVIVGGSNGHTCYGYNGVACGIGPPPVVNANNSN